MKVPAKKPHFFKPIQPGFKKGLKIPIGFLKYLKGQEQEHAVLRRAGKKWMVKVNGRNLEEGWEKFAEEHDLQLGNILVFRHEGNMEFEVVFFDSSHCDREYAEHLQEEKEATDKLNPRIVSSRKAFHHAEASTGQPHVEFTVKEYYLSKGYFDLPKKFARANGLINKKCDLIITDGRQRTWKLRIYTSCCRVIVGGKWRKFCVANDVKVGDRIMFEVVTGGERPIWRFHDKANPRSKAFHPAEASYFDCTVRPYVLSNGYFRLRKEFAMASGLMNKKCRLIIIDEMQRPWNLLLYTSCSQVYVGGRWRKFCVANDLKVGNHIRFEVVSNGEKPIWKFHYLTGRPTLQPEVKKSNLDDKIISGKDLHFQEETGLTIKTLDTTGLIISADGDGNPHFIYTIQPYTIRNRVLYLPKAFAKSNGLINRTEMVIVDEKQRKWPVLLGPNGRHFAVKVRGWSQLLKANGVRVGDTYKFELINNGTIPIAYFHCNYSGKGE